ncbi:MAG: hypothetical protein HFG75_04775 [Hungatella sp.]|nr:hypothetical protein [Hungatella sp.]
MTEQDTIELLRECDAGIKMGVTSIDEVLGFVNNRELRDSLIRCKDQHEKLKAEIETLLSDHHHEGKEPSPMAKGMSWVKTNMKLVMDDSDQTIAGLMTDGCNMGVKTLNMYLNQYREADYKSKNAARKIIDLEEKLTADIRKFL